ncbi:HD domain-containing phosphohydrolase [Thalassotalea fusca]
MDNITDLNVLVCDDSITNALLLTKLIEDQVGAKVITLTDPRKVAPTIKEQQVDLLVLDIEMPHMNGFDVMAIVRQQFEPDQLPILIITGCEGVNTRNDALASGANDFLNKPIDQVEVEHRVRNLLKIRKSYLLHEQNEFLLEKQVNQRTQELNYSIRALINSLATAGELRDNETGKHVQRVGQYAKVLAKGLALPDEICEMIELTAPLHDIGKIGIPDSILLKPARLTDEEREVMNNHTTYPEVLVGPHDSPLIQMAKSIAVTHHEKWDGSGYPNKLKGESIPIEGRITAIADVFDALTTVRPYKDAWPIEKAVAFIEEQAGKSFDPSLVTVFMKNRDSIEQISRTLAD